MRWIPFIILALTLAPSSWALTNGLALTPPMGYNTWYINHANISENFVRTIADTMATNGLRDAGYEYICLDDGWAYSRDTNGVILADPAKFPSGMKALGDYIHARGFKFGIYSVWGWVTCAGRPGSCGYVVQDADTYAAWGVDYLKYDACSACQSDLEGEIELMANALLNCGRPIFFNSSIDVYNPAASWMPAVLNSWRGTGDDVPWFDDILNHLDYVAQTPELAGAGHWNDPDVLQVARLASVDEAKVNFGMWCIVAAPLLLEDYSFSPAFLQIVTNREVIAVNQDAAGVQGVCVATNGNLQVWRKPLGTNGAAIAVALLNRGLTATNMTASWTDLGLPAGVVAVRDLWAQAYVGDFTNSYTAAVPPHGVQLLTIFSAARVPLPPAGTNYLSDLPSLASATNTVPIRMDQDTLGNPIQIHGISYAKGLGATPYSLMTYWLGGAASRFGSDIGLDDDACCGLGSVVFRVWADGAKLYDSGVITSASPIQSIDVDLTGRTVLGLEVTDAGNGTVNDYADWAGARIVIPPLPPAVPAMLGAAPAPSQIPISWYASPGAQSYVLERSPAIGGPYQIIAGPATPGFIDTNVVVDTTYYYVVAAVNDFGTSACSAPITCSLPAYWTGNGTNPVQSWNQNGNWTNTGGFPNAPGRTVIVNAGITADQTINLNQGISAGSLAIGDQNGSAAYTLAANCGLLTLDNGAGPAIITQLATSKGDNLAAPINVSHDLTLYNYSSQPLTLSGSNSVSGALMIAQGMIKAGNPFAFGSNLGNATVAPGAGLDLGAFNLACGGVTVSGVGPAGAGAIVNTSGLQPASLSVVTLKGDVTFGGTAPWDIRGNPPSGTAVLSTSGQSYNLTKVGPNQLSLVSVAVDPALGDIDIQQGTMSFEGATASMGNPSNHVSVEAGATLAFNNSSNAWNRSLNLSGDGVSLTIATSNGSNVISGAVTLTGNCVLAADCPLMMTGPITGTGSLIKTSGGQLALSGTNLYTGSTMVAGGSLSILGQAQIANSPQINIGPRAVLNVSGGNGGGFVLGSGQSLAGAGTVKGDCTIGTGAVLAQGDPAGTLTFSNSLTLAAGSTTVLAITYPPATNNPLGVAGNLAYGGELILAVVGTNAPALGDTVQLFQAASYTGAVAAILPRMPGLGLLWDTTDLSHNGSLRVIAGTLPQISPALSGNQLLIYGAGGTFGAAGRSCYLLTATNLALPMYQWICIATNQLDGSGNFSFNLPLDTANGGNFYSVRLQ